MYAGNALRNGAGKVIPQRKEEINNEIEEPEKSHDLETKTKSRYSETKVDFFLVLHGNGSPAAWF